MVPEPSNQKRVAMKKSFVVRMVLLLALIGLALPADCVLASSPGMQVEKVHFIIPGGAGGGWDGTARGVGKALLGSKLIEEASFQNMSGGGGGKALNHLITTAERQQHTLLVNSTPIIIRSLTGVFPQSFRDLTPIAAVVVDYAALVVPNDSKYKTLDDLLADFKKSPLR